jgi:serine/threonine protein phosphatase PrpC
MLHVATLVRPAGATGHDRIRTRSWAGGQLFALCDGAGGVSGAAEAAELVTEELVRAAPPPRERARTHLVDLLQHIDKSPTLAATAGLTTALVVLVADGVVQGASIGDSEAWLVSETDALALTAEQNRRPLAGSGRCAAVAFGPLPMRGTLVLGSDGLFDYCARGALLNIARSPDLDAIPELLLRASQLPSGQLQDDFAVLVCREAAEAERFRDQRAVVTG